MERRHAHIFALSACAIVAVVACGAFAGDRGGDPSVDADASAAGRIDGSDVDGSISISSDAGGDAPPAADGGDAETDAGPDGFVPPCPPTFVEPNAIATCFATNGQPYCGTLYDGGGSGCASANDCKNRSFECARPSDCNGGICCGQIFPSTESCPASGFVNESFCTSQLGCSQVPLCASDTDCNIAQRCHAFDVTIGGQPVEIGYCE